MAAVIAAGDVRLPKPPPSVLATVPGAPAVLAVPAGALLAVPTVASVAAVPGHCRRSR